MYIYLPEVKMKSGEAVDYSFEKNLSDCFDDFPEGGNLNLLVSVGCSGDKIMVSGSLQTSARAECSRCLESFTSHFRTDFADLFTLAEGTSSDENSELLALETANMQIVRGDYFYLDEYIRQMIILAQDYSPLCSPECKGLCAGCGTDLNRSTCRCDKDERSIDARLLKLKELRSGS